MTRASDAPVLAEGSADSARRRLRLRRPDLRSVLVLVPLLVLAAIWQAVGMAGSPQRIDDEGTYVAQAYAVQTYHSLGHYTYWYDHPPLGWIQLAAYTWTTDAFSRYGNAILAGREAMVFAQLLSCVALWALCRRLLLSRWASGLAVALFSLSPLAVQFHRTVYLDNIATPWILVSLLLALTPQRRLSAFVGSGLAFAIAVLTKETSLLLLPAVGYALWRNTGSLGTRRYAMSMAGTGFVLLTTFYAVYALIKGELLPGAHHVSLLDGIKFQLFTRQSSGNIFSSGTLGYQHVAQWLNLDPVLPVLSLLAVIPALFITRLRAIAVGLLVLLVVLLKPGYLPVPYIIGMLPLMVIVVAGVLDWAAAWMPGRAKAQRQGPGPIRARMTPLLPGVVLAGVIALAAGLPTYIPRQRGLFEAPLDQPVSQAETWIETNVPHNARLAVDDALWVDLVRAGFPRQNVVWYYKVDTDPAVERLAPRGWQSYDYLISTQSLRSDPEAAPEVNKALLNSVPYAVFGTGQSRVEVRRILPGGVADVAAIRAADAVTRRSAELGLLANPMLHLAGNSRSILSAGRLDLRAATALLAVSQTQPVTVTGLPADPAETAAGLPIRTVEVSGISVSQARHVLDTLAPAYQPVSITSVASGAVRIVFTPALAPVAAHY